MSGNRVVRNVKWIAVCKIMQSLLQLLLGMITARYLGPSNYGLIGYATSVVAFVVPIMQMGLTTTLIQELTDTPKQEGEILGSSITMSAIGATVSFILVCGFVSLVNGDEKETVVVCVLYSLSLFFRALESIQYWFQFKLNSKYTSIAALCTYIVISVYKIYLLIAEKSVYWFALASALEFAILGIALVGIYQRIGGMPFHVSLTMIKRLFKRGKYYIMASMMVTIFQNVDHVMLKVMYGDQENGFYTAAVTCAVVFQFIYLAITDSMSPVILENKKNHSEMYQKNISRLYGITFYMAVAQGIGYMIFAELIVKILYGDSFMQAIPVLRVIVWQISFSFMGLIRNIWILAEGKNHLVWKINLLGVVLNVVLNSLLIPLYGAVGAAVASLCTQVFSNFILGYLIKSLRENNRLMLQGLNPKILLEMLSERRSI